MKTRNTLEMLTRKFGLLLAAVAVAGIATAQSFTLIGPPAATTLPVEGMGTNTAVPSWNVDSTIPQATYNWVLLDGSGQQLVSLPSDNGGSATSITLDFATVDGLLASLNVAQGASVPAQWYVESTSGTMTNSSDTFAITLNRGVVLLDYDLDMPAAATAATIEGLGTNEVPVSWTASNTGVNYDWVLYTAGGMAEVVRVPVGTANTLVLDFATIDAVLDGAGVMVGQTANLEWNIEAFGGMDTLMAANGPFAIDLTRGNLLQSFSLDMPMDLFAATIEGLGTNEVDITWGNGGATATYDWVLMPDGGGAEIVRVPAGASNMLTLDFTTIDAVLAGAGVTNGQMASLDWTVEAMIGTDTLRATQAFSIDLTKGVVLNSFDLSMPMNGFAPTVAGLPGNEVDIMWASSNADVTYEWILRTAGGAAEIIRVPTGTDNMLTLDFATIDAVLEGAGVTDGATANLEWTIHAYAATDSLPAMNGPYTIDLTKGSILDDYAMTAPMDGFAATIDGAGDQEVDITWESSDDGVTYEWILRTAGGAAEIIRVPTGTDNMLTLDFATIDAVLDGAGVMEGETANLEWIIHAYAGADSLPAVNGPFAIDLTRGTISSVPNVALSRTIDLWPNPAQEVFYLNIGEEWGTGSVLITVVSAMGTRVFTTTLPLGTANVFEVPVDWAPGSYFVYFNNGQQRAVKRLIVQ